MSENLTRDRFTQHLNTLFHVEGHGAGHVSVELVEATEARAAPGYEAFSIVFRGPLDTFLPQAIYRFHHDALGAFELFIVPILRDDHGIYYEAVINRMRRQEQE